MMGNPPAREPEEEAQDKEAQRMECPACGCRHLYVIATEHVRKKVRRRRQCRNCGRRITTYEDFK